MPPKRRTPKSATRGPTRSSSRLQASHATPEKEEVVPTIPSADHDDGGNQHQTPGPSESQSANANVDAGEEGEQSKVSEDALRALNQKYGPSSVTTEKEEFSQTKPPSSSDENQRQTPPPPSPAAQETDVDGAREVEHSEEAKDGGVKVVPMDPEESKTEPVKVVKDVVVEKVIVVEEKREILETGDEDSDGKELANQHEIFTEEGRGIGEPAEPADEEVIEGEEHVSEEEVEEQAKDEEGKKESDRDVHLQEGGEDREGDIEGSGEEKEIEAEEITVADAMDREDEVGSHDQKVEETRAADADGAPTEDRKKQKDYEVFIGGLDKNVVEEDLKKVFSDVGEVVEVRLVKKSLSKGFAFVRFATIDQAKAATELKSVKINGRDCGVTRNTDNETLFLRNISRTWTSATLMEKLQSYKIENLVEAHLIDEPDNKGKNRGYAFLEFCTHMDAVTACTKLQKRGVYFGTDSPVEVAFAKSAVQPDDGIMAQVKSVFLDGLSSSWDEEYVKEQLKIYGEIESVELARGMVTAKRKDFAFVNFTTREAALACIDALNKNGIGTDGEKVMVRASLRKPLQKKTTSRGGWRGSSRKYETPRTSYSPVRATGYGYSGRRSNYSKGDRVYRNDFPPSSARSSTWHARDIERRAPTYSHGGRSRTRYVEDQPYVSGHREEYPAYSGYSSQKRYSDDAYVPRYEHYPATVPIGHEYPPLSGSKRPYSGTEDDMLYERQTRSRTHLGMESVQAQGSSTYHSYSRAVPQAAHGYGNVNQSFGNQYLSGSSGARSYY